MQEIIVKTYKENSRSRIVKVNFMPYCSKCGSEVKEEMKFCPKCGASTTLEEAVTAERYRSEKGEKQEKQEKNEKTEKSEQQEKYEKMEKGEQQEKYENQQLSILGPLIGGFILIIFGFILYLTVSGRIEWGDIFPFFLIILGGIIIIGMIASVFMAKKKNPMT